VAVVHDYLPLPDVRHTRQGIKFSFRVFKAHWGWLLGFQLLGFGVQLGVSAVPILGWILGSVFMVAYQVRGYRALYGVDSEPNDPLQDRPGAR
jgi:hypothetical protein